MGRDNPVFFCDQYNAEFNRCLQPMKDGYTDNYYMQMAQNIRRYKGVRPIPELKGLSRLKIDGDFTDWSKISQEYRDTKGDVFHRDYRGYGGLHYVNNSGRNDIVTSKVAVDQDKVYFFVETDKALSQHTGDNWMYLLIDADKDPTTGWFGYDYLVNKKVVDEKTTTLMAFDPKNPLNPWVERAKLNYRYMGNELELDIPRNLLGLSDNAFTFDFKWCDNPADLNDPISLCVNGDTAPNRRFNFRCIWEK
jgi:hypothetical protein